MLWFQHGAAGRVDVRPVPGLCCGKGTFSFCTALWVCLQIPHKHGTYMFIFVRGKKQTKKCHLWFTVSGAKRRKLKESLGYTGCSSLRLNSVSLSGVNSLICWLPLSTSLPPCLAWSANLRRANARWHFVTRILNSYPQYNLSSHSGAHDIHKSFPVSINFILILRVVSPDILTNRCSKSVPKVHCHQASQECPQPRL